MHESPDPELLLATLRQLDPLLGVWKGQGQGQYPTIDSFEYSEELRFALHAEYPMLAYEQKTVLSSGEASHWEYGFIRPVDEGVVELSNVQDSGRVEVLRATLSELSEIHFQSVHHGHDPRMVATERFLKLEGDRLEYKARMSTTTTPQPEMQCHLKATLIRAQL